MIIHTHLYIWLYPHYTRPYVNIITIQRIKGISVTQGNKCTYLVLYYIVLKILIFPDYIKSNTSYRKRESKLRSKSVHSRLHNHTRLCTHEFDFKIYFRAKLNKKSHKEHISFRSSSYKFCDHRQFS